VRWAASNQGSTAVKLEFAFAIRRSESTIAIWQSSSIEIRRDDVLACPLAEVHLKLWPRRSTRCCRQRRSNGRALCGESSSKQRQQEASLSHRHNASLGAPIRRLT
jgi:hypothetical protein